MADWRRRRCRRAARAGPGAHLVAGLQLRQRIGDDLSRPARRRWRDRPCHRRGRPRSRRAWRSCHRLPMVQTNGASRPVCTAASGSAIIGADAPSGSSTVTIAPGHSASSALRNSALAATEPLPGSTLLSRKASRPVAIGGNGMPSAAGACGRAVTVMPGPAMAARTAPNLFGRHQEAHRNRRQLVDRHQRHRIAGAHIGAKPEADFARPPAHRRADGQVIEHRSRPFCTCGLRAADLRLGGFGQRPALIEHCL